MADTGEWSQQENGNWMDPDMYARMVAQQQQQQEAMRLQMQQQAGGEDPAALQQQLLQSLDGQQQQQGDYGGQYAGGDHQQQSGYQQQGGDYHQGDYQQAGYQRGGDYQQNEYQQQQGGYQGEYQQQSDYQQAGDYSQQQQQYAQQQQSDWSQQGEYNQQYQQGEHAQQYPNQQWEQEQQYQEGGDYYTNGQQQQQQQHQGQSAADWRSSIRGTPVGGAIGGGSTSSSAAPQRARRSQWDQAAPSAATGATSAAATTTSSSASASAAAAQGAPRPTSAPSMAPPAWLDRAGPPFPVSSCLLIKGLPAVATENNIRGLFNRERITLGRVTVCTDPESGRCKGYAFADIANADQANNAVKIMHGLDADGVKLSVRLFRSYKSNAAAASGGRPPLQTSWGVGPNKGGPGKGPTIVPSHSARGVPIGSSSAGSPASPKPKLYLSGLSYQAREHDIRSLLQKHRLLFEGIEMPIDREAGRPKGYAYVDMYDEREAQRAVRMLDDIEFMGRHITAELKTRTIAPSVSVPPNARPGPGSSAPAGLSAGGGGGGGPAKRQKGSGKW
eukprot:CAMPEP_0206449392 /NCGR_PEP_ID=MMETSP0324_2-20121206/18062_1 /ASSEMBLY_ACC=CAM_ASM_000836 /TAXON_ID=2866 /ORGANISM="Crypthecodinium cohnii, Strain Seligo" /LENGTH=557 /DNA_ID=CAMNT_0053918761 /DNA_START=13 /DNA_END=1686 /DNA_ORIENTATION=-